ncbi:MAG: M15 family metallopeptidase [Oscillospiraceae bacterium]
MAKDPYDEYLQEEYEEEQRGPAARRPAGRRRSRIKKQQIMLAGSFLLAGVLLVSVVIMFFADLIGPSVPVSPSGAPASGSLPASGEVASQPQASTPTAVDPSAWNLNIISPAKPVDSAFTQPELTGITQQGVVYWFDTRAAEALQTMMADCNAQTGGSLRIVSAFRSYRVQNEKYTYYYNNFKAQGLSDETAAARALEYELPAGSTEHHTGLAVDFVTGSVQTTSTSFDQSPEFQWLKEHSPEYGFILRYPAEKTDVTGVAYEPFHFRYVGVEEAKAITAAGITLEEYVAQPAVSQEPAAGTSSQPA